MRLMNKGEVALLANELNYAIEHGYIIVKSNMGLNEFLIDLNILTSKNSDCNYCMYKQIIDLNDRFYYLTSDILGLKYVLHEYQNCFELKLIY